MTIMSPVFEPAAVPTARGWTLFHASWQRLSEALACSVRERRLARTLRQLGGLETHELADMGLTRSDLTPRGLARMAALRAGSQAAIETERGLRG